LEWKQGGGAVVADWEESVRAGRGGNKGAGRWIVRYTRHAARFRSTRRDGVVEENCGTARRNANDG